MSNYLEILTPENAEKALTIVNIAHPEWGVQRFNYQAQPLGSGDFAHTWGQSWNSAVMYENEMKFWGVVSFKSEVKKISNEICAFSYEVDSKEISGMDLTDHHNEPRCYNTTRKSVKKAWEALEKEFTKETTMYQAIGIFRKNGVRMHSYMAMD